MHTHLKILDFLLINCYHYFSVGPFVGLEEKTYISLEKYVMLSLTNSNMAPRNLAKPGMRWLMV